MRKYQLFIDFKPVKKTVEQIRSHRNKQLYKKEHMINLFQIRNQHAMKNYSKNLATKLKIKL